MSAAVAAAAAAACRSSRNSSSTSIHHTAQNHHHHHHHEYLPIADHHHHHRRRRRPAVVLSTLGSRYESQKRREWMSFMEYMRERRPGLVVSACSGDDVVEFLKYYLDGDGDDQKQQMVYWGSVEATIGRLRVAFEEIRGGQRLALALAHTTPNPFNAPEVRLYLRRIKEQQHQLQQLNSNFNNNVFLYHNYL